MVHNLTSLNTHKSILLLISQTRLMCVDVHVLKGDESVLNGRGPYEICTVGV